MKRLLVYLLLCSAISCSAAEIGKLLDQYQGARTPNYPVSSETTFKNSQKAALTGDVDAQGELFSMCLGHLKEVYAIAEKNKSLLFSVRKLKKGVFDAPSNNYAENIENFFKNTTDKVRVNMRDFTVQTTAGEEWVVKQVKYSSKTDELEVMKKGSTERSKVKLSELRDLDQKFIQSALVDKAFDSKLSISYEDDEQDEVANRSTDYTRTVIDGLKRTLVVENKSKVTLRNLLVEYQSFAEQTLLGISEDLPEDYCSIGFFKIDELVPGEKVERVLDLPRVEQTIKQTTQTGDTEYYIKYPANSHLSSEGGFKGLWVKVHRITPYGERLEVKEKGSGVPAKKWCNVLPLYATFD